MRNFASVTLKFAVLALAVASSALAAEVSGRLQIAPTRVVRGVPSQITVAITNNTRQPYAWPTHVVARLTNLASGKSTFVHTSQGDWQSRIDNVTVPAGQTIAVVLDAPVFLDGNRFIPTSPQLPPDRYRLELAFGKDEFRPLHRAAADSALDPAGAEHRLSAEFEVIEPDGEDAVVYARLRGALAENVPLSALGQTFGRNLPDWVWQKHPSSSYAPFLRYVEQADSPTAVEVYERSLAALADRPAIRDAIRFEYLDALNRSAGHAYATTGEVEALKVVERLERVARELEGSPFPANRERLKSMRGDLWSRERLAEPEEKQE